MANDLASFSEKIRQAAQNIERNSVEIQKDIAMRVLTEVVQATPVDTGRAISNWLVESGSAPSYHLDEAHTPGQSGTTRESNIQQTVDIGDKRIASHRKGELHITNNLDYIADLNEGSSKKAPAHFVQIAALSASKSGAVRSILASTPGARVN